MTGSWEKEGTLRDVQNVKTCSCVHTCVCAWPSELRGGSRQGLPVSGGGAWILHPLPTPSSKLAWVSERNCGPLRQATLTSTQWEHLRTPLTHLIVVVLIPHVVDDEVGPLHSWLQLTEEVMLGLLRACRGLA